MYIEEIIIEGFKSYASRTTVGRFDPHFNAITGLNGSGKSNILDAICFVLGISNLSHLRASSLQELIYKQGQSGITKASVTIIFNNMDKRQSPPGYENSDKITITRQILMGGRTKYLVNGHVMQPTGVQNLFQSVQLNVNNPHFLIMQGRITKVVNMKPLEVVAMIEEAAGTRMYEVKREAALKTIAKKDKKLQEIEDLFQQDITPTLERLRKERANYMRWIANQEELERLKKCSLIAEYQTYEISIQRVSDSIQEKDKRRRYLMEQIGETNKQLQAVEKQLKETNDKENPLVAKNIRQTEEQIDELAKELVRVTTLHQIDSYNRAMEENEKDKYQILSWKEQQVKLESKLQVLKQRLDESRNELSRSLRFGTDNENQSTVGVKLLQEEIEDAQNDTKQVEIKLTSLQKQIASLEEEKSRILQALTQNDCFMGDLKQEKAKLVAKQNHLKVSLHEIDFDQEGKERLDKEKKECETLLEKEQQRLDALQGRISQLELHYDKNVPGLNGSKVYGILAQLFHVKDLNTYAIAIETTAGGKMFQIVVDNEQTAKKLLEKGGLKQKVTIIPLNRIKSRSINSEKIAKAQNICPQAQSALSCVEYDAQFESAMQFAFGSTIICPDNSTANNISFNPDIKVRTVTLQGDIYDPAGTLTGGSRPENLGKSSILQYLAEAIELKKQTATRRKHIEKLNMKIAEYAEKENSFREKKRELELVEHELQLLEKRFETSEEGKLQEKLKSLEMKKNGLIEEQKKWKQLLEKKQETVTQLQEQLESCHSGSLQNPVERLRKEQLRLRTETEGLGTELQTAHLEKNHLQQQSEELSIKVQNCERSLEEMQREIVNLEEKKQQHQQRLEQQKESLEIQRQRAREQNRELVELETTRDELCSRFENCNEALEKEVKELESLHQHQESTKKRLKRLEQQYHWIVEESQVTSILSESTSTQTIEEKLSTLQQEQSKLDKVVNKKVSSMFEQAEQEYQDLLRKKRIVESDRRKIQTVIRELDEKKILAVEKTWKKVNEDLASIFSTLLPNSSANLVPLSGKNILDGLEIQVSLNNCWKKNLSELSGGQRSLVALSLILALLRYKPAPVYILDEVDAALDLSHTQNIGTMLRKHFAHSQFIIVSLKEGMFNNANILFRTKLLDGSSTVERLVADNKNSKDQYKENDSG
eukprot:jgi/Galph1/3223/GphlegSOOS_G1916.1